MNGIINKRALFGDEYRALGLCEFQKEMPLIKQLLKLTAEAVDNQAPANSFSYDGVCHMFAKSVIDSMVMAYDNMLLGHFYATQMILRTVVENSVCLNIIQRYPEYDLWKYYLIQSFYKGIKIPGPQRTEKNKKDFEELCEEYGIAEEFLIKSKKKGSKDAYAYIDKSYGWTYPVNSNNNFTFSNICSLVTPRDYADFKLMSMYSHGTSLYLKISGMASVDHIMSMISLFYYNINKLIASYCPDSVPRRFDRLMQHLEDSLESYIKETEQYFAL